jgi:acid stress chaperone HdeB
MAVKDFCATSPQMTVMSAAERALGIKMPRPK